MVLFPCNLIIFLRKKDDKNCIYHTDSVAGDIGRKAVNMSQLLHKQLHVNYLL